MQAQTKSLFRSEPMSEIQIYIPRETARDTVAALGEAGLIEFSDLNASKTAFQRTFVRDIRRLEETERRMQYFADEIEQYNVELSRRLKSEDSVHHLSLSVQNIEDLSQKSEEYENRIRKLTDSEQKTRAKYIELDEYRRVLLEANKFFDRVLRSQSNEPDLDIFPDISDENDVDSGSSANLINSSPGYQGESSFFNISFISGVISQSKAYVLQRVLWRALHGNLYMTYSKLELSSDLKDSETKTVFFILAHGQETLRKIKKITESMGAHLYSVDNRLSVRSQQLQETVHRIEDLESILHNTLEALRFELNFISEHLSSWFEIIIREKGVYQVLNCFLYDSNRKLLVAEGWCSSHSVQKVQRILKDVSLLTGQQATPVLTEIHSKKTPPTFQNTNKYTEAFQSIIESYGIATYQEVNPTIVSIVTFPFFFAVMFGDLGHGFILLCMASYLILNEKKLAKVQNEIFQMAFYGRYVMFLMGVFSMFTGLIYNDLFSKPITLFSSGWKWSESNQTSRLVANFDHTYPIGLDPAWHESSNLLLFTNSLKMKMSVILGIIHMTFSLFLSIPNYVFFDRKIEIYTVFLPSLLFMESIFGYLVLIIIYKWSVDWSSSTPPGILNTLIYMFLSPGKIVDPLYKGQSFVQIFLLLVAFVCVPWLLLSKPLYMLFEQKKAIYAGYQSMNDQSRYSIEGHEDLADLSSEISSHNSPHEDEQILDSEKESEEQFNFSDIMVHQVIHTIEFCLGCISYTASYLRLWALSLAHNQLSVVLWNMTLANALSQKGYLGVIMLVILFVFWFVLTLAILVAMEGTSAMLHSLRLHWVEAMSKHYEGAGVAFMPFSFKSALDEAQI